MASATVAVAGSATNSLVIMRPAVSSSYPSRVRMARSSLTPIRRRSFSAFS